LKEFVGSQENVLVYCTGAIGSKAPAGFSLDDSVTHTDPVGFNGFEDAYVDEIKPLLFIMAVEVARGRESIGS
jgi:hypothetical protein